MNPFDEKERDLLSHALEVARAEMGGFDPFNELEELSVHQQHYTREEFLMLLSVLENVEDYPLPRPFKKLQWLELYSKIQGMIIDFFKNTRIQEFEKDGCKGHLIFFNAVGGVPLISLIPDEHLQHLMKT